MEVKVDVLPAFVAFCDQEKTTAEAVLRCTATRCGRSWRSRATMACWFLTVTGQAFSDNRMTQMVRNCVRAAGLGNIGSCHLFRHAMATQMLENGADVRFIQAMLGHADIKTTPVYTRVSIRALKDIHSATHPARLTRATLKPDEAPAAVANLLDALDAEAQAEGETEE